MKRSWNFNPGPAALPLEVLEQAMEASVSKEACKALAEYMNDFCRRRG